MFEKMVKSIPIPDVVREQGQGYFDAILACDADGVLVDFDARVQAHATVTLSTNRSQFHLQDSRTYFYHRDPATGLSREQMGHVFRDLMGKTKGGIGDLEFYAGAIKAIKKARRAGIGIRVLTSVPGALDSSPDAGQSYGWGTSRELRTKQFLDTGIILEEDHIIFCAANEKPDVMLDKILLHIPLLIDDRASTLVSASRDNGLIAVGIESSRTLTLPKGHGLRDRYGVVWFNTLKDAMPHVIQAFYKMQSLGLLRGFPKEVKE